MNCSPCKNEGLNQKRRKAFTLIEMIGVLAVIAILAALLVPKVFSAINDARINGTCVTCETVKTAIADHYGKYGKLDQVFGTNALPAPIVGYDTNILMAEGLLDKPFIAKVAGGDPQTSSNLQLVTGANANAGAGYRLDGVNVATTNAQFVIEAVLSQVAAADAKDLNDRIDGTSLGAAAGQPDTRGRVEYGAITNGTTTVYIYLTHR